MVFNLKMLTIKTVDLNILKSVLILVVMGAVSPTLASSPAVGSSGISSMPKTSFLFERSAAKDGSTMEIISKITDRQTGESVSETICMFPLLNGQRRPHKQDVIISKSLSSQKAIHMLVEMSSGKAALDHLIGSGQYPVIGLGSLVIDSEMEAEEK